MKIKYIIIAIIVILLPAGIYAHFSASSKDQIDCLHEALFSLNEPFKVALVNSGCRSGCPPQKSREYIEELHKSLKIVASQTANFDIAEQSELSNLSGEMGQILDDVMKSRNYYADELTCDAKHKLNDARSRFTFVKQASGICDISDFIWFFHTTFHELEHTARDYEDGKTIDDAEKEELLKHAQNAQKALYAIKGIASCEPYNKDEMLNYLIKQQFEANDELFSAIESKKTSPIKKSAKKLRTQWVELAKSFG